MKIVRNIGIALLPISILYAVFIEFFTLISVWIFCLGIIFILLSLAFQLFKVNVSPNIQTAIVFAPFLFCIGYFYYYHLPLKQALIIPKDFEGILRINYGQDVKETTKKDGYYIIKVGKEREIDVEFAPDEGKPISTEGVIAFWDEYGKEPISIYYSGDTTNRKAIYYVHCSSSSCTFVVTNNYYKYFKPNTFNELIEEYTKH